MKPKLKLIIQGGQNKEPERVPLVKIKVRPENVTATVSLIQCSYLDLSSRTTCYKGIIMYPTQYIHHLKSLATDYKDCGQQLYSLKVHLKGLSSENYCAINRLVLEQSGKRYEQCSASGLE